MFVIVAIFCGIAATLYWPAHGIIFVDITNNGNRKSYTAIKKIAAPAFFEKQSMPKKMRMVRDNPCPSWNGVY